MKTESQRRYRRKWKSAHKAYLSEHAKKYTADIKLRILSHYGGKCTVCGITDPAFLTIDHVDNDGAEHRRKIGNKWLYGWLLREGLPSGFQVLCWNHNHLKHVVHQSGMNLDTNKAQRDRLGKRRQKNKVIKQYGGHCRCCGETDVNLLTIDHVGGHGNEHRRSIGVKLYSWLIDHNFPTGFQVLCFNCNDGKRINGGVCPHTV